MTLERDLLDPHRYQYLSEHDSALYDKVVDSSDETDQLIRKLLEDKAAASRREHAASVY